MSFLRDSTLVFVYRLVLVAVIFVTDVAIARWFGPAGKGYIAILTITPFLLAVVGGLGLDYGLNELGHRFPARLRGLMGSALLIAAIGEGALVLLLWADAMGSRAWLFTGVPSRLAVALRLGLLLVPAEMFAVLATMYMVTAGSPVAYARSRVWRRAIVFAVVVVVVAGGERGSLGIEAVVAGHIVGALVPAGLMLFAVGYRPTRAALVGGVARSALRAYAGRVAERLQYRVDYVLMGILSTSAQLGVYTVATAIAEMIFFVTGSVGSVLQSRSAETEADLHRRTLRLMMPISVIMAFAAGAAGTLAIPIVYGTRFQAGVWQLWILLPGVVAMSLVQVASPWLVQIGRAGRVSLAQALGLAVNVGINVTLIPRWGAVGAALASSVSYAVTGLLVIGAWLRADAEMSLHGLLPDRAELAELLRRMRALLLSHTSPSNATQLPKSRT
jgi:O-antigen/teichoic acid export membrane protein